MSVRWVFAGTAAFVATLAASDALADCNITILPQNGTNLGKIVPNTTVNGVQNGGVATTFTVPVGGGSVSQSPAAGTTGAAILLHPPSSFQLKIDLISGNGCSNNNVPMSLTMQSVGAPGVTPAGFTITPGTGTASISTTSLPGAGGTFTLTFQGNGNGRTASITVGSAITLPAHSASGTASWIIKVTAG